MFCQICPRTPIKLLPLPEQHRPLLLPRLVRQGSFLPVLHDVREGELEVLVNLGRAGGV